MESFRELFELYKKGLLAENRITELNRCLIEIWFHSPQELTRDESDYTEDLVFEQFSENRLDAGYAEIFREKVKNDKSLSTKYSLSKQLTEAAKLIRHQGTRQLTENNPADEKEEAELKVILEEVIGKVHAEKEVNPIRDIVENFINLIKRIRQEFRQQVQFNQPRVRLVMVLGSLAIIAGFAWLFLKPGDTIMVADNKLKHRGITNQQVVTEKPDVHEDASSLKELVQKKLNALVTSAFEHATRFDYALPRGGETTSAEDSFILAADKYNNKKFDTCIVILNDLLKSRSFTDPDTMSEINFYLGNCYLVKGINQNRETLLKKSLQSFQRIIPQNKYYNQAKWYSIFAYAKMGQAQESLRLCDTLMKIRYLLNYREVKRMRDSIQKIISTKSD
jgi:hypothetical protein